MLGRHVHGEAYAALVLSGGYEEAGDHGRFKVNPGDVVFHDRFEGHLDRFFAKGAVILNLPLAPNQWAMPRIAQVTNPDSVARMAETNTHDLDFGAILAATHGDKPSVVQIRSEDVSPDIIGKQVVTALRQMAVELEQGALLTINPNRIRIRILPLRRRDE